MKNVKFYGDLKEDIELTKSMFSFPRVLFNNIMAYFIPLAAFAITISLVFSFSSLAFLVGLIASTIISIPRGFFITDSQEKDFLECRRLALANLQELSFELSKHDISVDMDKLDQALIQEVTNIQKNHQDKTETTYIDRNVYFLDNYDTLQVLRETIVSTKENDYVFEKVSLALLEPNEKEQVEQNVEKKLTFKR